MAVNLRAEHSYESGYDLQHLSLSNMWRSQTAKILLGNWVSPKFTPYLSFANFTVHHRVVDLDSTSICSSDPPTTPISPESDQPPIITQTLRRRPIRGYRIHSDDDDDDDDDLDEDDQHFTDSKPTFDDPDCSTCIDEDTFIDTDHSETGNVIISHKQPSIKSWLAFSLLPVYTEKVEVPPPLTRLERVFASFTMYSELKVANMDSHFEKIFARLQLEWTYVGGLVC